MFDPVESALSNLTVPIAATHSTRNSTKSVPLITDNRTGIQRFNGPSKTIQSKSSYKLVVGSTTAQVNPLNQLTVGMEISPELFEPQIQGVTSPFDFQDL